MSSPPPGLSPALFAQHSRGLERSLLALKESRTQMLTQEPKSNLGDVHPTMARCRGLLWAWEQEAGRAEVCGHACTPAGASPQSSPSILMVCTECWAGPRPASPSPSARGFLEAAKPHMHPLACKPAPPLPRPLAPTRLPSAARGAHGKRAIFLLASEPLLSVDSRRRPLEGVNRVLNLFLNFIMQFIKFSV